MLKITILALALLVLGGNVHASGQAVCRLELPLRAVCFAEQTVMSIHSLELMTGAEIELERSEEPASFTPYRNSGAWGRKAYVF